MEKSITDRLYSLIPKESLEREDKYLNLLSNLKNTIEQLKALGIEVSYSLNCKKFIEEEVRLSNENIKALSLPNTYS